MVGQSTLLVDGNHRFRDLDRPMLEQGYDFSPVVLEDDAVLTTKCTVVGARIGRRSYVGAGAVVVDDIPAYSVAVGVPARVVDSFGPEGDREAGGRRRLRSAGLALGELRSRRRRACVARRPQPPSPRGSPARAAA